MNFFSTLLVPFIGFSLVQAAPATTSDSNIIQNGNKTYKIVDIEWTVQINNTATPYDLSVTGTIQDVLSNISRVDQAAGAAINETIHANLNSSSPAATADLSTPGVARYTPGDCDCNVQGWGTAYVLYVNSSIDYLNGVPGQPRNGPGPGNCGRVSCYENTAIWWCNNNDSDKVLDSFSSITEGASLIVQKCTSYGVVTGQQFYQDGWNVIVRADYC